MAPAVAAQPEVVFERPAESVIVIHPTSSTLLIGRAMDGVAKSFRHIVARRRLVPRSPDAYLGAESRATEQMQDDAHALVEQEVRMDENRLIARDKLPVGTIKLFNQQSKSQKIMEINDKGADWTDADAHPPFLWGQAASQLSDDDEASYDVYEPLYKGKLNVTPTRPIMTVNASTYADP